MLRHIVHGCAVCGGVYRALAGPAVSPIGDGGDSGRGRFRGRTDRREAANPPAAHAWLFAVNSGRAARRLVAQLLVDESFKICQNSPRNALRLVDLGTAVAERILGPGAGNARVFAWIACAHIRKLSGDFPGAELALGRAAISLKVDRGRAANAGLSFSG